MCKFRRTDGREGRIFWWGGKQNFSYQISGGYVLIGIISKLVNHAYLDSGLASAKNEC